MGFALESSHRQSNMHLLADYSVTNHVCNNRRNTSYMLKDDMHLLHVHYCHTGNAHDLRPLLVHEGTNDPSHSSLNLISSTARQAPGQ